MLVQAEQWPCWRVESEVINQHGLIDGATGNLQSCEADLVETRLRVEKWVWIWRGLWGQKLPKLLNLDSGWRVSKLVNFFECSFIYLPRTDFGSIFPRMGGWWGKSWKIIQIFTKTQFPWNLGPKSRLWRNISKIWSTFLCIKVLRALMPNLSKIGLFSSRGVGMGRTGFAWSTFLEIPRFEPSCPSL